MDRQYAREQKLPPEEAKTLQEMSKTQRATRAKQLFERGWTLQAIGDAFVPPVRRSTIQYWVKNAKSSTPLFPVPSPWGDEPDSEARPRGYLRKTPISPGIRPEDQERLAYLAPLARSYRSGMSSTSLSASANEEFNQLVQDLYNDDVKIAEIAKASNVTNRAIARRLGK